MNEAQQTLRTILRERPIAALGTLHHGEPYVSMVPFAAVEQGLVIHVSRMSPHTSDMTRQGRVSVLVVYERGEAPPQAFPRVTIQGDAEQLSTEDPRYAAVRRAYLVRFPDAEPIFELGDFSIFLIRPASLRVIAGFGRAVTLSSEEWVEAVGGASS